MKMSETMNTENSISSKGIKFKKSIQSTWSSSPATRKKEKNGRILRSQRGRFWNLSATLSGLSAMLMLVGCSDDKKPLKGARETILSSDYLDESGKVEIDKTPVVLDAEISNTSFPQPYLNSAHCYPPLKFSNHFLNKDAGLHQIWSVKLDYEGTKAFKMISTPIVAEGKIFCIDAGGVVYAFNAKTGAEIWRKSVTIVGKEGQIGAALAYDSGRLIVSSSFSECFCLNAKNGRINWRIKLPANSKGDAITISEGRVFLVCSNSSLQVVDIDDGKTLWTHSGITSDSLFLGNAAAAVSEGIVYVAYPSGEIFALMIETGTPVWESSFPKFSLSNAAQAFTHPKASPVVKDGIVYFVAANEQTAAYEAKRGKLLWIKDYGGIQTPIVSGNSIFVFNSRSELLCLNRFTGALRWKTMLDRNNDRFDWYGMALIKDFVVCISPKGRLSFVSAKTGKIMKAVEGIGSDVEVNPIISDSVMYILDGSGELGAYK